jgi:predicted GNAT superfamily acetyltransferase
MSKIVIQNLDNVNDFHFAINIFDLTWEIKNGSEITPNLLKAMIHGGSYLAVAFIGKECVGASFAFPATTRGLHIHSHMTAVLEKYRNQGVGYELKIDQWRWAKKNNYEQITWTFDPLVARNAKLNLTKLGVNISNYYPNFYGDMQDMLNAGDESDRVMASWQVVGEQPVPQGVIEIPDKSDTLIKIPEDIVAIRSKDIPESLKWRRKVRQEFMQAFEKGGKVIGFSANNEYVVRI